MGRQVDRLPTGPLDQNLLFVRLPNMGEISTLFVVHLFWRKMVILLHNLQKRCKVKRILLQCQIMKSISDAKTGTVWTGCRDRIPGKYAKYNEVCCAEIDKSDDNNDRVEKGEVIVASEAARREVFRRSVRTRCWRSGAVESVFFMVEKRVRRVRNRTPRL